MAEGITHRSRKTKPWQAWIWDAQAEKKIYRSFATQREAKRWRADALRAQNHGVRVVAHTETPTLAEAADDLIDGMLSGRIPARGGGRFRESVAREYRLTFDRYVLPRLGRRRLPWRRWCIRTSGMPGVAVVWWRSLPLSVSWALSG
jgi:hypothetical protein